MVEEYNISIARACKLMEIYRSYYYYTEKKDDAEVEKAIIDAAKFDDGFWKIYQRLRREGKCWNHKKVYRVYKAMHFNKRSKLRKRLPAREKHSLVRPLNPNVTWSIDFVSDKVECGRQFRVLNILDDFNRCAVAQEISMSMPSERVIKLLEKVIWINGKPENIRCDNGPEFISTKFKEWCKGNRINIMYIQPGKPTQNSYIERFNGSYRRAVLDRYIFRTLEDVRIKTEEWMNDYNENRPHDSLGDMSPNEYRREYELNNNYINLVV